MSTFDPEVACSEDCKDEKEEDEKECFQVVSGHSLHSVQNRSQQFALRRAETVARNEGNATVVCGWKFEEIKRNT